MISHHHEWRPWQPVVGLAARRDVFRCLDCGMFLPADAMGKGIDVPGCIAKFEGDNSGFRPFTGRAAVFILPTINQEKAHA